MARCRRANYKHKPSRCHITDEQRGPSAPFCWMVSLLSTGLSVPQHSDCGHTEGLRAGPQRCHVRADANGSSPTDCPTATITVWAPDWLVQRQIGLRPAAGRYRPPAYTLLLRAQCRADPAGDVQEVQAFLTCSPCGMRGLQAMSTLQAPRRRCRNNAGWWTRLRLRAADHEPLPHPARRSRQPCLRGMPLNASPYRHHHQITHSVRAPTIISGPVVPELVGKVSGAEALPCAYQDSSVRAHQGAGKGLWLPGVSRLSRGACRPQLNAGRNRSIACSPRCGETPFCGKLQASRILPVVLFIRSSVASYHDGLLFG